MYRVLIVDDDLTVRIRLKNLISWELLGCEIAGEAAHGLFSDCVEHRPGDFRFRHAAVQERHQIGFGKHAAARCHRMRDLASPASLLSPAASTSKSDAI